MSLPWLRRLWKRKNITTEEHPLGVYHPHKELHHIKKENIGLIEVMDGGFFIRVIHKTGTDSI